MGDLLIGVLIALTVGVAALLIVDNVLMRRK
jgi:hypothetical protein